ncbi:hypothetical protein COT75_03865 [Candidatus Beckwithbacteria bacterium CG10_big_fil_rev_8_21_14_0_10_34_10]|uniref:Uncharacterized protein n=1 Tax=Candidatus Beckwithbacteria bacterium CG10_big_fil_rev_8_21_14_0_10_34_10 TaxID=1974495 RepID=A0A2H0W8J4_9BACT|nr:MAG: hypothetical protein COT75_03865 [Candidatus Beckwithbacteria bacterium CG10_big_fil_rev_8_21_14_0_10_34_10]
MIEGVFTASNTNSSMEEVACILNWGVILGRNNSLEVDKIGAKLLKAGSPSLKVDIQKASIKSFGRYNNKFIKQIPKVLEIKY